MDDNLKYTTNIDKQNNIFSRLKSLVEKHGHQMFVQPNQDLIEVPKFAGSGHIKLQQKKFTFSP